MSSVFTAEWSEVYLAAWMTLILLIEIKIILLKSCVLSFPSIRLHELLSHSHSTDNIYTIPAALSGLARLSPTKTDENTRDTSANSPLTWPQPTSKCVLILLESTFVPLLKDRGSMHKCIKWQSGVEELENIFSSFYSFIYFRINQPFFGVLVFFPSFL